METLLDPQSPTSANPVKPHGLPDGLLFSLAGWPLAFNLWLNDHTEKFWYLTYLVEKDHLNILFESEASLKCLIVKLPLGA